MKKSLFVIALLTSSVLFAASPEKFGKNEISNLIMGINSENEGLQKSSIYFAGKYSISETAEEIFSVMEKSKNPSIKYLCAVSLLKMESKENLEKIYGYLQNHKQESIYGKLLAVYNEYLKNNSDKLASK